MPHFSNHSKVRSEHGTGHATGGFVVPGWSLRGGSRQLSKVSAPDDGHSHLPKAPSFSDSPAAKGFDRHARMKLAMVEAQQDPMMTSRSSYAGSAHDDGGRGYQPQTEPLTNGSESPRAKIAAEQAEAKAQIAIAQAQAAAARGDIDAAREPLPGERPGEGSLTFDILGNAGEVVLADGIPPTPVTNSNRPAVGSGQAPRLRTAYSTSSSNNNHEGLMTVTAQQATPASAQDSHISQVLTESPTETWQNTLARRSASPNPVPSTHERAASEALRAAPKTSQTVLVLREETAGLHARDHIDHLMTQSQSTFALLSGRPRKLSDASSSGGYEGSFTCVKSKKAKPKVEGIASALAASGVGMAGMGVWNPSVLAEAHAKAAAEAAAVTVKKASQAPRVEADYVGGSQGGVYRDPTSGLVTEKDERGRAVRQYSSRAVSMSRKPSSASLTESEGSSASGLGAAANFSSMQANALLTPTASLGAGNAHGAPTIALDSSHAETPAFGGASTVGSLRLNGKGKALAGSHDGPVTAASSAWTSDIGSQITGFAVASSKRNADFHALFPSVPDDDYLIEDYGCALVREVFLQGRLYVSENHVCFFANIFGWVTNIILPFTDIVFIEKRMTALIIPNAIQIATLHVKHTFSSLLSRDTTFDLMANIWKLSHPDVPVTVDAGEVGGSDDEHSEEDDGEDKESKAGDERRPKTSRRAMLRKKLKGVTGGGTGAKDVTLGLSVGLDGAGDGSVPNKASIQSDAQGGKDVAAAKRKVKHSATQCLCDQDKKHLSTVALDATYPTMPAKMFDLLFRSDFMKTFWTDHQKLTELDVGPWKGSDGAKTRDFSYIKPLSGGFGPKQTRCVATDEEQHIDFDQYITVLTTTRTPDVPSGGSFCVKTRTCLTWKGNGNHTKVFVTCATEWTGRSMLRGVIDKASIDGQKEYYKDLDAELLKHIKGHAAEFKDEGDDEDDEDVENAGSSTGKSKNAEATSRDEGQNDDLNPGKNSSAAGRPDCNVSAAGRALELVKNAGSTIGGFFSGADLSPSMLVLVAFVALLLISNIWALSSSGAGRGQQRDPLDPHRLKNWQQSSGSAVSGRTRAAEPRGSPEEVAHAVRDVLRDYFDSLIHRHAHRAAGYADEHAQAHRSQQADPYEEAAALKQLIDEVEERLSGLKRKWEGLELDEARGALDECGQGKLANALGRS